LLSMIARYVRDWVMGLAPLPTILDDKRLMSNIADPLHVLLPYPNPLAEPPSPDVTLTQHPGLNEFIRF
jgi:hypothetical protein